MDCFSCGIGRISAGIGRIFAGIGGTFAGICGTFAGICRDNTGDDGKFWNGIMPAGVFLLSRGTEFCGERCGSCAGDLPSIVEGVVFFFLGLILE